MNISDRDLARFKSKMPSGPADECWPWPGQKQGAGYGVFTTWANGDRGTRHLAHRVSAWLDGHDIDGKVVRHKCDNPICVNPAHLEPGTQGDNIRDALARGRLNMDGLALGHRPRNKTHCNHGHAMSGTNVRIVIVKGRPVRACRTCRREQNQAYRARVRAER